MNTKITILVMALMLLIVFIIQSFSTEAITAAQPLKQRIPEGFPPPVYTYKNNPLTKEGFMLGRRLFYEGMLSKDGYTACASCHQQFAAFSDFEHVFSHGFNSALTTRNAPPLFNLAWQKDFHLDGAINHIEVQPLAPITAPNEMAESLDSIIHKLQQNDSYRKMFRAAFGSEKITSQQMLKALAQFTGSIVSADSKYDRIKKGKAVFSEWEKNGYVIFQARCATCHTEPLFTDLSYRNIGLPVDTFLNDYGRQAITGDEKDIFKFKVPSLRNVTVTAPYMHDGRFWGLSTAIDHFATKNKEMPFVDSTIAHGKPLDKMDVKYLVSFLFTLTDSVLLNNKSLSDPLPGYNNIHAPLR